MTIRIAGYAAVFDVPDKGRDVVRRGAFQQVQPGAPLLWQHDATRPIGRVETVNEDGRGLRVIASVTQGTQAGDEAVALLKSGAIDGMSFGYRVRRSRSAPGGMRELLEVELIEVSLVTFPMQPLARVLGVA